MRRVEVPNDARVRTGIRGNSCFVGLVTLTLIVAAFPPLMAQGAMPHKGTQDSSVDSAYAAFRFPVPATAAPPRATSADLARRSVADTGRMRPGHQEFSRYTTPMVCWRAVANARRAAWRHGEHDTMAIAWTPERDTLPTRVIHIAQQCGRQFSVDAARRVDLPYLQMLSLAGGDEPQARAAADRMLVLARTAQERKAALLDAFEGYTNGGAGDIFQQGVERSGGSGRGEVDDGRAGMKPLRMSDARRVLAQLDAMGDTARVERVFLHAQMLRYYFTVLFDTTAVAQEIAVLKALVPKLTAADGQWLNRVHLAGILETNYAEVMLDMYRHGVAQGVNGMRKTVLDECRVLSPIVGKDCVQMENVVDFVMSMIGPNIGTPAPMLQSAHWFNVGSDSVRPVRGKVNYIVELYEHGWGRPAQPQRIAFLKRMHEKYGPQGLVITIVQSTHGSVWSSGPLTPREEANAFAWYYLDYWKVPTALVVSETEFSRDALGRRTPGMSSIKHQYPPTVDWLIDRNGNTISPGFISRDDAVIEAFIRQALSVQ